MEFVNIHNTDEVKEFVLGDGITIVKPTVRLLDKYAIGKYTVMCSEYREVYNWAITNGYQFNIGHNNGNNYPVTGVSWVDTILFCNAFSEMDKLEPVYYLNNRPIRSMTRVLYKNKYELDMPTIISDANGYRLPTEAQWEFAARDAGIIGGNEVSGRVEPKDSVHKFANIPCYDESCIYCTGQWIDNTIDPLLEEPYREQRLEPVGQRELNGLGLADMIGNCYEWTSDAWEEEYRDSIIIDRKCEGVGRLQYYRVVRGAAYCIDERLAKNATRVCCNIFFRMPYVGFRVLKPIDITFDLEPIGR